MERYAGGSGLCSLRHRCKSDTFPMQQPFWNPGRPLLQWTGRASCVVLHSQREPGCGGWLPCGGLPRPLVWLHCPLAGFSTDSTQTLTKPVPSGLWCLGLCLLRLLVEAACGPWTHCRVARSGLAFPGGACSMSLPGSGDLPVAPVFFIAPVGPLPGGTSLVASAPDDQQQQQPVLTPLCPTPPSYTPTPRPGP